jgi:hypothetical protein
VFLTPCRHPVSKLRDKIWNLAFGGKIRVITYRNSSIYFSKPICPLLICAQFFLVFLWFCFEVFFWLSVFRSWFAAVFTHRSLQESLTALQCEWVVSRPFF